MYLCVGMTCVCKCLSRAEPLVVSCSCGCWTWTLVPWKSIIYSYLLSHPSSPSTISFHLYFKGLKTCCSSCCLQGSFPGRLHLQVGCLWELRLLSFGILYAFPKRSTLCPSMLTLINPPPPSYIAIPYVSSSTLFNKAGSVFKCWSRSNRLY